MFSHKQLTFVILAIVIINKTNAGPLERSGRMAREVYPEIEPENERSQAQVCIVGDVVYSPEELVPAEQPCLKCKCRPPSVVCETVQCQKRPGCKAIHRSNNCCPDYQCECEFNGKLYANGEKLELQPGGECKVCYCRGGEVQCAEVSCYIRKDCEGRRVPGQCCSKYDHCPPIDILLDRPVLTTEQSATVINKEVFDLLQNSSDSSRTSNEIQDDENIVYNSTTQSVDLDEKAMNESKSIPKITIQEIIPEAKEIPITAPPKFEEPQGTLLIEEATDNSSNNVATSDSDVDSSKVSEVFHHAPPVLRIGDKLLFLKKDKLIPEDEESSPASVITIIGAEGLQRGGFEESGEVLEIKVDSKNETKIYTNKEEVSIFDNANDTNDLELKTSESTHILSLVRKKASLIPTTTTVIPNEESIVDTGLLVDRPLLNPTIFPKPSDSRILDNNSAETATKGLLPTLKVNVSFTTVINNEEIVFASTVTPSNIEQTLKSTEPIIIEQNPAYPPIPEIMSPYVEETQKNDPEDNQEQTGTEADKNLAMINKILPEVLQIRNNHTLPENISHSEWLKKDNGESLQNFKGSLPEELLNQPAPSDFKTTTEFFVNTTATLSNKDSTVIAAKDETTLLPLNIIDHNFTIAKTTTKDVEETTLPEVSTEENKSIESIESINNDSGESTTPKTKHASLMSNENASVEKEKNMSEATDMVSLVSIDSDESAEIVTKSILEDVEMIDDVPSKAENHSNTTEKDVELINVDQVNKSKREKLEKPEKGIYEMLPEPVAILESPTKVILKRENSNIDEAEEVFKELEKELSPQTTDKMLTPEEEKKESDQVFRELLEETNSPKEDSSQPRSREAEALQRVSDALAKLTLRGKQPDSGILGVLTNFFSSQYKFYD